MRRRMWLTARARGLVVLASLLLGASTSMVIEEAALGSVTPIGGVTLTSLNPGTHALAVAIDPDGNLWFVGSRSNFGPSDNEIGRITPAGEITEFALSDSSFGRQDGIAVGPDGNLWFTENEGNRIGRITAAGEITEFPLPNAGSRPNAITAGPDGNLWFTEGGGDRVGRITPAGAIAEFSLRRDRLPASIAVGSDGNLWFTEKGANRVGRITAAGLIAEFPLPGPNGRPDQITAGPDGNLWFTFEAANKIGRITPLGEVDLFPVPTSTGTEAIAAAPDGNVWFTSRDRLGSISPSGHPARLSCPNRECHLPLLSLATGSDGLWFGTWRSVLGYGGGLTEMTQDVTEPGYVGRLTPRASGTAIGSGAQPVVGRRLDLRLSCTDAGGCRGALKLLKRAPGYIRRSSYPTISVLAHREYQLASGESRRIPLYITRRAARLLASQGSLPVWATAGTRPDVEAIQPIVLRPRAERRAVS